LFACHTKEPEVINVSTPTIAPHLVDRSLLTGNPCGPPCWYGINPGESSEAESLNILEQIAFIDSTSIILNQASWIDGRTATLATFNCITPISRRCGTLTFVDELLVEISIPLLYELTFNQAVSELGPPDYLFFEPIHVQVVDCAAGLVWEHLGIVLTTSVKDASECDDLSRVGQLSSQEKVVRAVYRDRGREILHGGEEFPWTGFAE
jgi:hypothetical protein